MSPAQQIALTVVVKAILLHSDNKEIVKTIKKIADSGFKYADSRLQAEIDESLMNWINSI
jgi:hypothetical protein